MMCPPFYNGIGIHINHVNILLKENGHLPNASYKCIIVIQSIVGTIIPSKKDDFDYKYRLIKKKKDYKYK